MDEKENELDIAAVLALDDFLKTLEDVSLDELVEHKRRSMQGMARIVEDAKLGRRIERSLKKKRKPGRPRVHWRVKKAKEKARLRAYYQNVMKPKRKVELAKELQTEAGWYKHCAYSWKQCRKKHLSEKEWSTWLWPRLEEKRVPTFRRLNTRRGFVLDNIVMLDSDTREVLFDGSLLAVSDVILQG